MPIGRPHSGPVSVLEPLVELAIAQSTPPFTLEQNDATLPQIGLVSPAIQLKVSTPAGGAPVTVDTGFVLPLGHGGDLEARYNLTDTTGDVTSSSKATVSLRNIAPGGYVVAGTTVAAPTGDAALGTAAPSFTISGGTLHVTLTPPAAYANAIRWILKFDVLGN